MMEKFTYGNTIEPACAYCAVPKRKRNGTELTLLLCPRHGAVAPDFRCLGFRYNPVYRLPSPPIMLDDSYSPEDFRME